jgi:hypothetical protein
VREAVISGIKGWKTKIVRRKAEKKGFYRHAASTMSQRYRKKLTAKTTWYKISKKKEDYVRDEEEEEEWREKCNRKQSQKPPDLTANEKRQVQLVPADSKEEMLDQNSKNKTKAVLFVPYTIGSTLVKRMKEAEEKLLSITA